MIFARALRIIVAALAVGLSASAAMAQASETRAQLQSYVSTNIGPNGVGAVTGTVMQRALLNQAASTFTLKDVITEGLWGCAGPAPCIPSSLTTIPANVSANFGFNMLGADNPTFSLGVNIVNPSEPFLYMNNEAPTIPTDAHAWTNTISDSDGFFHFRTINDAGTSQQDWLIIGRSGLNATVADFTIPLSVPAITTPSFNVVGPSNPFFYIDNSSLNGGANLGAWDMTVLNTTGTLQFNALGDSGGSNAWMSVTRSGFVPQLVTITPPIAGASLSLMPTPGLAHGLNISQSASGAVSADVFLNNIVLGIGALADSGHNIYGFGPTCNVTSTLFLGQLFCGYTSLNVSVMGSPGFPNDQYVGHFNLAIGSANTTDADASVFAGNDNVQVTGTGWAYIVGREIDVTALHAITNKYGLKISQSSVDGFQGSIDDAAILMLNQGGAIGWKNGIEIGASVIASGGYAFITPNAAINANGFAEFGTNSLLPSSGVPFLVHAATNVNFTVTNNAGAVDLQAINDALGAAEPMQIAASSLSLPTITAGTWNGSVIGATYGGSGVANALPFITTKIGTTVNFNSVADTSFTATLPAGATGYIVNFLRVYNCSASITSAQFGVFSAAAGGGFALVPVVTGTNTATGPNVANSAQNASSAVSWSSTTSLFFRVTVPEGSAATCAVDFSYAPIQ